MPLPYKIVHVELSAGVSGLPLEPAYEKIYLVFWWAGTPLGHQEVLAAQLPMSGTQVAHLAVQAITPAVGNRLLPNSFRAALSEHFERQFEAEPPDFHALLALDRPLHELTRCQSIAVGASTSALSVIVCTRDRPQQLVRCLQSLQQLSWRPQEIIVVDNAPTTAATYQLVAQLPRVHYIFEPRPGLSVARNTGIRHTTGDIVVFTDDDVVVHPDWLGCIQQAFQDPSVMAVTGQVLPAELETEAQVIFEVELGNFGWGYRVKLFDSHFFQATKKYGAPVWRIGAGANMAFRRRIFELVGNFDERLGAGAAGCSEDSELWYRILAEGWQCRYEPTAVVYHYHRRDLAALRQQMYQYIRGHVAALFIQFSRYRHLGNLVRLFYAMPGYYLRILAIGLLTGFRPRHKTYLSEVCGYLAGVKFYMQHRDADTSSLRRM